MSIEYPCVHWNEGKCKKFSDDKVTSWCVESSCKEQTPSNADRIRAMSDEELAEVLNAFTAYFDECNRSIEDIDCHDCELCELCSLGEGKAIEWLKQPAGPQKGE